MVTRVIGETSCGSAITLIVAVYGALLSSYVFYVNRRDKRRQITVAISNGFLTSARGLSQPMLFITVTNPGERSVRVNNPGLLLPDKRTIIGPDAGSDESFPHDLCEGTDCKVWYPLKELAEQLAQAGFERTVRLIGFCDDAVGKRHKGKPWKLDLNEWLRHS